MQIFSVVGAQISSANEARTTLNAVADTQFDYHGLSRALALDAD